MDTILITGGTGFIGTHLIKRLSAENKIVSLSLEEPADTPNCTYIAGDIRDTPLMSAIIKKYKPTKIVHLAAMHFIPECNKDWTETLSVNVAGTASLLQAAQNSSVQHFIFASSAAVYASTSAKKKKVDGPTAACDIYGTSKIMCEELLTSSINTIPATILRLFNVYGPGSTKAHLIPEILRQAKKSNTITLGNTMSARDYIYVTDVVTAFTDVATQKAPKKLFTTNVGTGIGHTATDIVATISQVLGKKLDIVTDTKRLRASDPNFLIADVAASKNQKTKLKDGIAEMI